MAGIDLTDEQIRTMDPSERKDLIERLERPAADLVRRWAPSHASGGCASS